MCSALLGSVPEVDCIFLSDRFKGSQNGSWLQGAASRTVSPHSVRRSELSR
jgi:hypothetical protein